MSRRYIPFILAGVISTGLLFLLFQNVSRGAQPFSIESGKDYGSLPGKIGSGSEEVQSLRPEAQVNGHEPSGGAARNGSQGWSKDGVFKEPKIKNTSPYPVGKTKPAGSNYTRTVVVPRMDYEHTDWIEHELGDMIDSGLLRTAIYHMDDPQANLHPVVNKGHEVMAYLTYLIDHYDSLSDITIFIHAHRYGWHNNHIVDLDMASMLRYLSPERVTREGYMNLRCHWEPGCPNWIHPGTTVVAVDKMGLVREEEQYLSQSWAEMFPNDPIPRVLAQPCCGQFALSRERIRSIPREKFVGLRDWVIKTPLRDDLSGRVFEYVWQYVFTDSPVVCPSMAECYCDGYGWCFDSPKNFDYFFELRYKRGVFDNELKAWKENAALIESAKAGAIRKGGRLTGQEELKVPEPGRDIWLEAQIKELTEELDLRAKVAFELGRDPRQRAKEAGREWKEGDGF